MEVALPFVNTFGTAHFRYPPYCIIPYIKTAEGSTALGMEVI